MLTRNCSSGPTGFSHWVSLGWKRQNPVQLACVQRREGVSNVRQSTDLHPFRASQQSACVRVTLYTKVFTVGSFPESSRNYGTFPRSLRFSPCVTSFAPQSALHMRVQWGAKRTIYQSWKPHIFGSYDPIIRSYAQRLHTPTNLW